MNRAFFAALLMFIVVLVLTISWSFSVPSLAKANAWTLVWSDEFSGAAGARVNTANWLYETGTGYGCQGCPANWGTGEVEKMASNTANVYLDGAGHLAIKPIRGADGTWTSGRIETQRTNFAAPLGGMMAVEASIRMPNVTGAAAAGYWPAFWMLGAGFRGNYLNWPGVGEIDIMENINGINKNWGTLHCGVDPGGPCNETTGLSGQRACLQTTCQAGFHTYRMEYDRSVSPEELRWYLDGVQFWQINSNQVDATTWANALQHGFFIILNVAIGGAFPAAFGGGPTAATTSGIPMLVDYVRVYTSKDSLSTHTFIPSPTSSTVKTALTSKCPSDSFVQGVVNSNANTALPWFQPCGWAAGYVILHYISPHLLEQDVSMTYNGSMSRWEYRVSNISQGQVLQYAFTYRKGGLQYNTGWYSWTYPASPTLKT